MTREIIPSAPRGDRVHRCTTCARLMASRVTLDNPMYLTFPSFTNFLSLPIYNYFKQRIHASIHTNGTPANRTRRSRCRVVARTSWPPAPANALTSSLYADDAAILNQSEWKKTSSWTSPSEKKTPSWIWSELKPFSWTQSWLLNWSATTHARASSILSRALSNR